MIQTFKRCLELYTGMNIKSLNVNMDLKYPYCRFLGARFYENDRIISNFVHIEGILFKTSQYNIFSLE